MIALEEVRRIAELAKIRLEESEIEAMASDLARVIEYVDQLRGELAPTEAPVPEMESPATMESLREDSVAASLESGIVAANAPEIVHDHFSVPRILGAGE